MAHHSRASEIPYSSFLMSSTPQTPFKPNIAAQNDQLESRDRAQRESSSTATNGTITPPDPMAFRGTSDKIQVPATLPRNQLEDDQTVDHEDRHKADHEEPATNGDQNDSNSSQGDLAPFDWEDFERRYRKALLDANKEEDMLLEDFENLAEVFGVWAQASSQDDNQRSMKRLKTRERYVQLSERGLEDKKQHYIQVVQAFKDALALLGR